MKNTLITLSALFLLTILPSIESAQAQNIQQVIQGMQARWNRIRDASAVLEIQTWDKTQGEAVNVFYGQIFYRAPRMLRLEYSPAIDFATGTSPLLPLGGHRYVYIHDGRKLMRYNHAEGAWVDQYGNDPVISMVNQITDINNFNVENFMANYQVGDVRSDSSLGIPTLIVRAEPKRPGGAHPRQLMWLNARNYLPVEVIMAKNDNEVSAFFHKIVQNPNLPVDMFSTRWKN